VEKTIKYAFVQTLVTHSLGNLCSKFARKPISVHTVNIFKEVTFNVNAQYA
jgi:hypothetical protein